MMHLNDTPNNQFLQVTLIASLTSYIQRGVNYATTISEHTYSRER